MEKRLLLAGTTLLLASCGQQAEEGKELPLVNTVTAEQVSAPTLRSYTFISEPYRQVDLSFRVGGPVKTFDALPGQVFTPSEAYLTRTATSNNISFQLTALIDNPSNSLPGGMAGSLSLSLPLTSTPSVLIPQAAVCHNAEKGSYVWTVGADNRVSAQPVRLGRLMDNNRVEVTDGLDHGQRIAASRLTFLQDGQEIATQDNQQ
ncbi:efflux RND transporter periplasmic adaptor subunit [Mediterranea massiliensis]|uniref:efflux RND transporter periplasmic adaptor subunit n=1 Tax=Mediterranea massiliensis TaxID=1841865 RepID=UPI0025A44B0C|nr:hypothetical protein [Mediterranea massiliensis]MDM8337765.1 hypothetical protein [Mediterranea massiliensis]